MKLILITLFSVVIIFMIAGVFKSLNEPISETKSVAADVPKCGLKTNPNQGPSMVEFGFTDPGTIKINTCQWCEVGDFCAFICTSSKCNENYPVEQRKGMNKLLVKKESDCYWFEGNPSHKDTVDSRDFGWLCGDELKIAGKVIPPN